MKSAGKGRDFRAAGVPSHNPGTSGAAQDRKRACGGRGNRPGAFGSRKRVARRGRWGAGRGAPTTERESRGGGCRPAGRPAVWLRPRGQAAAMPLLSRLTCCGVMGKESLPGRIRARGRAAAHRLTAQAHCPLLAPDRSAGAALLLQAREVLGSSGKS